MNCEQRMDDMQRFVDNDLTYAEQENLMAHIKQCPDCAASFEQLQRLSAELSLLPMVTPPFSIVDSIMPKLAELDAQQAAIQVSYLSTAKLQKKSYLPWKIGGGLVAAAVIFGLIINMQPNTKFDASGMLGATSQKSAAVADTGKSLEGIIAPEAPTAKSEEDKKKITVEFSSRVNGADQKDNSKGVNPDSSKKVTVQDQTTNGVLNSPADKKADAVTSPAQAPKEGDYNYSIAADKIIPTATPSAVLKPMPSATPAITASPIPAPALAPAPQNPILASDDGNFIGMVERQIVLVKSPDGNRIYTSAIQWNVTDKIVLVQWQENQRLIYEVRMEDGLVKRFIVDPILKTEQEQKAD
jgi:anti-sigma factor RsiW